MSKYGSKLMYPCNDDFFSSLNELSLYWAGFLAADGSVRKTSAKSRVLLLTLANKDRTHLELFKKHLDAQSPIFEVTSGNSQQGKITITSSKIFDDLANFNIVQNKTLVYEFPQWLTEHTLVHHFMRGYVDGDGCFRIRHRGKCQNPHVYMSLRGTEIFLRDFKSILEDRCSLTNDVSIIFDCRIGKIEYGGNKTTSKIASFLYKDATIFLPRKYEIAKKSLEIITDRNKL
jgi:hypothetical protein